MLVNVLLLIAEFSFAKSFLLELFELDIILLEKLLLLRNFLY